MPLARAVSIIYSFNSQFMFQMRTFQGQAATWIKEDHWREARPSRNFKFLNSTTVILYWLKTKSSLSVQILTLLLGNGNIKMNSSLCFFVCFSDRVSLYCPGWAWNLLCRLWCKVPTIQALGSFLAPCSRMQKYHREGHSSWEER